MTTGTRTQVALTRIAASPRILRVSSISLRSSSVWSSPSAKAADLRQHVEGDLVRVDRGDRVAAVEHRARLAAQLVDRRLAGAGDRLVGGDDEALDPGRVVERLQRDDHLHGRAVRVGDDPLVAREVVGVDLGDDERHVVVHAPVAGVVDDDGARLDKLRRPLGADRAAGRGERRRRGPGSCRRSARGPRAPRRPTRSTCRPSARRRTGPPRTRESRARRAGSRIVADQRRWRPT